MTHGAAAFAVTVIPSTTIPDSRLFPDVDAAQPETGTPVGCRGMRRRSISPSCYTSSQL